MVFCSQCGVQGQGRFCSQCGTRLYVPESESQPPPAYQQLPEQQLQPEQPPQSPTALIDPNGQVTPAFYHLASEFFIKLDQSIGQKGTGTLEPAKMAEFRRMSGKPIPQHFGSHVLPLYCECILSLHALSYARSTDVPLLDKHIGAECVPNTPKPNILTWNGWHTFLYHKIVVAPSETYTHFLSAIQTLGIQLPQPLLRGDLPLHPFPEAVNREQNFQQEILRLAGAAARMQMARVATMTGLMRQAGMGAVNAVGGGGGYGFYRRW